MSYQKFLWRKWFIVLRPVPDLLHPGSIAVSETQSTRYRQSGAGQRPARKEMLIFQYTLSGRGVFERAGHRHDLTPGRGFFCPAADEKTSYYYPDDATEPWRFLFINIFDSMGHAAPVSENFGYVFDIDPSEPSVRHLLSYGEVPESTIQIAAGAAHVFASTLIGMLVDQAQCETRQRGAALRIVKKALNAIENAIDQPFNATVLAKKIGVSQEHLNRIFREELGRTPYQCICETKMQRACQLLKNTDQTVATIAGELGYSPDSHFARLFKRVIGVNPSQYRSGASLPILNG